MNKTVDSPTRPTTAEAIATFRDRLDIAIGRGTVHVVLTTQEATALLSLARDGQRLRNGFVALLYAGDDGDIIEMDTEVFAYADDAERALEAGERSPFVALVEPETEGGAGR